MTSGDIFYAPGHGAYTPNGRIGAEPPICACGAIASTVWTADGEPTPLCAAHAADAERALFNAIQPKGRLPLAAYLYGPDASELGHTLRTWSGTVLAEVFSLRRTRSGFGGERMYFQARDASGRFWYGSTSGVGMLASMHRCAHTDR